MHMQASQLQTPAICRRTHDGQLQVQILICEDGKSRNSSAPGDRFCRFEWKAAGGEHVGRASGGGTPLSACLQPGLACRSSKKALQRIRMVQGVLIRSNKATAAGPASIPLFLQVAL